jgi:hypothetical protein
MSNNVLDIPTYRRFQALSVAYVRGGCRDKAMRARLIKLREECWAEHAKRMGGVQL